MTPRPLMPQVAGPGERVLHCDAMSDLADLFRRWGHLQADLDPLGRLRPWRHPDLEAAASREGVDREEASLLRAIYCGPIGAEFMHLRDPERCRFVAERMEAVPAAAPGAGRGAGAPSAAKRRRLLERLASAELFERFLQRRYVGTKRYSLEGAATVIPLLDAVLDAAAGGGVEVVLIGMTHRGRLNVMHHIVGTPAASLFAGFEDVDPRSVLGGGDLKYHKGATGIYHAASGADLQVHLVSNPSHLEAVDPVVMGRARARQERIERDRPGEDGRSRVLPITLHGDAAFAGQGIAAETFNLADLPAYTVGGTVRVIVNNLIGFTTEPGALHSTRYASDVARRLDVPILHVNGLDPEAAVRTGGLALEYRAAFRSDVVVDLIGFRRYGHSEVDDPTTTQPLLYAAIEALPMLWQEYARRIGAGPEEIERVEKETLARLAAELEKGRALTRAPSLRTLPRYWDRFAGGKHDPSLEVGTAVPAGRLEGIARALATPPGRFHVHPKVRRGLDQRLEMGQGKRPVDWGMAEALAFGSLLLEGVPVRLSGQDTRRGTFNQRHAVLVDTGDGSEYAPLQHLEGEAAGAGTAGGARARFQVYDSPLSEAAPLGFEYGYSRDFPETLVLWEAQFGDFANGAQVIIDQFLASGEDKWGLLSGLVLLLPHGYEGQGPEHSSARIERFLDLAGEENIQVCQPSTAAQYFHLLRRQALRRWRKPLVVFTPKGTLRAAAACSPLADFTAGCFRTVLPDDPPAPGGAPAAAVPPEEAARVLVCSGKIAHELRAERDRRRAPRLAVVRLEQLYPFPEEDLAGALAACPVAREIVWVQEEPRNMGALAFVRPRLQALAGERHVTTVTRSESASPATGSAKAHALEREALLSLAFARTGA